MKLGDEFKTLPARSCGKRCVPGVEFVLSAGRKTHRIDLRLKEWLPAKGR
ncbi:MAG: hypothetical protein KGZ93_02950 [Actinobacteria bacterium]|nr:hypothetical protein [Actinomycetota bacterium]